MVVAEVEAVVGGGARMPGGGLEYGHRRAAQLGDRLGDNACRRITGSVFFSCGGKEKPQNQRPLFKNYNTTQFVILRYSSLASLIAF